MLTRLSDRTLGLHMDHNTQESAIRANIDLFHRLQQAANAKYFSGSVLRDLLPQTSAMVAKQATCHCFLRTLPELEGGRAAASPDYLTEPLERLPSNPKIG